MSRSKKSKLNPSSFEDYHQFLKNPSLADDYLHLFALEIIPGRFVNFPDFISYNLHYYFKQARLSDLFAMDAKTVFYPSLIHLFYTNMSLYNTKTDVESLNTLVKGTEIELTVKSTEKILHIPYKGLDLRKIDTSNNKILLKIFLPGQGLLWLTTNSNLLLDS